MAPIKKYDERSGIETTIFRKSDRQYQLSVVNTDENRLISTHVGELDLLQQRARSIHANLRCN